MQESFIDSEFYLNNHSKEKINVFNKILDNIAKSTIGDSLTAKLKALPKFNIPKMQLQEIDEILKRVTKSIVFKLYQIDTEGFCLREVLDGTVESPLMNVTAVSNVSYAVFTSVSPMVLSSLLYYFEKNYLYFYIRDFIVEPNYREYVKEIREKYDQPTESEILIQNTVKFKNTLENALTNMLADAGPDSHRYFIESVDELKELIKVIPKEVIKTVIETDLKYPIPSFLSDVLLGDISTFQVNLSKFLENLRKTFTLEGLRNLFKTYGGTQAYGADFDYKVKRLYDDRCSINNLFNPIDNLLLAENLILNKLLIFKPIDEADQKIIDESMILTRIQTALKSYPSIGVSCKCDNEKLTVTYKNESKDFFYHSTSLIKDQTSPFNMFGQSRDRVEHIYFDDPNKFCANQSVITKKERSAMMMEGRINTFKSAQEKIRHRRIKLGQLLRTNAIRKDRKLMEEISRLRAGDFDTVKYVKEHWFEVIAIDDPKRAALVLAEMEGINLKIQNYLDSEKMKQ